MDLALDIADTGIPPNCIVPLCWYDRFLLNTISENPKPVLTADLVKVYHTTFGDAMFANSLTPKLASELLSADTKTYSAFFYNSIASTLKSILFRWCRASTGQLDATRQAIAIPGSIYQVLMEFVKTQQAGDRNSARVWGVIQSKIDSIRFALKINPGKPASGYTVVDQPTLKRIEQTFLSVLFQFGGYRITPESFKNDLIVSSNATKEIALDNITTIRLIVNMIECLVLLYSYEKNVDRVNLYGSSEESVHEYIDRVIMGWRGNCKVNTELYLKYSHLPITTAMCMIPWINYELSEGEQRMPSDSVRYLAVKARVTCTNTDLKKCISASDHSSGDAAQAEG